MRKILLLLGSLFAIFLSLYINPNSAFAGRWGGEDTCYKCAERPPDAAPSSNWGVILQTGTFGEQYGKAACFYTLSGDCGPGGCPTQETPAENLGICPADQNKVCSDSATKGCIDGTDPGSRQCDLTAAASCPSGTNDQCTNGLGTTVCPKNYCVYDRGDGTLFQMTPKALSNGKRPFCKQLETPPETNPDDVEDPIVTNTPLSQPCAGNNPDGCQQINTALGTVFTGANNFTRWLLGFVLSISGGIVILIIIVSGYRLMTSQGDPEKVKNARDQLTAAIVGLLFIIFSLVILELITKDILGLPGFGG